jgi:nucleoside-diphosphate-sugar epimerase
MLKPFNSVLVTGAAGLLGSHLVDTLLARGYTVTGLDNLSLGTLDNLESARTYDVFTFIQADVKDRKALSEIPRHDVIVHMAAYKIEVPGLKGTDILETNSFGTAAVLDLAQQWGSRFVFASTSDVYGRNTDLPFNEDASLILGSSTISRWGYAASKIFDEHLCFAHTRQFNTPVTVIRYFNTYGPRHELTPRSGGPQALFFDALLRGNDMIVHGDGSQLRCFAYVEDSIEMTALAMESPSTIGEILNIGNPHNEISIKELAELAHSVFEGQGPAPIQFITHKKIYKSTNYEEVNRRVPDITKAVRLLGYRPAISNAEGLKRTLNWQRALPCYEDVR